jgi:hypothetical protein
VYGVCSSERGERREPSFVKIETVSFLYDFSGDVGRVPVCLQKKKNAIRMKKPGKTGKQKVIFSALICYSFLESTCIFT